MSQVPVQSEKNQTNKKKHTQNCIQTLSERKRQLPVTYSKYPRNNLIHLHDDSKDLKKKPKTTKKKIK